MAGIFNKARRSVLFGAGAIAGFFAKTSQGATMPSLMPTGKQQYFFPGSTSPLVGGKLYTYAAGTSVLQPTYQDAAGTIPNTNPITLDSTGSALIYWSGSYKIVLKDAQGNTVYTVDNYSTDLAAVLQAQLAAGAGSSLVGFAQADASASVRTAQDKLREGVSIKDFGAKGDGVADDTAAIQKAINAVSNAQGRMLHFPAGIYNFTKLYCYYDAAVNPGYNAARNGKISLIGEGISPENGGSCGTVLNHTGAAGNGLIVSPASMDANPYSARDFVMRGISLETATSGFAMELKGSPSPELKDCQIVQRNAAGSGIDLSSAYFGSLNKVRIRNTAAGPHTGDAIRLNTTVTAGLLNIRNESNISGFANGLHQVGGQWQQVSITDSEIAASVYPIWVEAGSIQVLNLDGDYFEGACTSYVFTTNSNGIKNLNVNGCWMLGSLLTGPAFDIKGPNSVAIHGGFFQDCRNTFLNINGKADPAYTGAYTVDGICFSNFSAVPTPVTLFTGVIPTFLSRPDYATSDANVTLFTTTARPVEIRADYRAASMVSMGRLAVSHTKKFPGQAADIYHNAQGTHGAVDVTLTAAAAFLLTDGTTTLPNGLGVYVKNNKNSLASLTVRPQSSATAIAVLPAGTGQWFFFNKDDFTAGGVGWF